MKVRIKSGTRVNGQHLPEGKVIQVADEDGRILLAANKAEVVTDAPKPASSDALGADDGAAKDSAEK